MHTLTARTLALSLLLCACSIEPAGGDMAVQGGLVGKPKPVEPAEGRDPPVLITNAPCAAMTEGTLDFVIDTDKSTIFSVEAQSNIEGEAERSDVTFFALNASTEKHGVPASFTVSGGGSAWLVDADSNRIELAPGQVEYELRVPNEATFELRVSPPRATTKQANTPHMPPGSKKAVIKPVPRCPG
jgi:hypothetical protein